MTRLLRAAMVAVGVASFLVAEALSDDKTRNLVAALFPSDAEYVAFLNDPEGAFLPVNPWIEGAA